uniref:Zgc:171534 n=1 Tax=Sinocyclocheilus grahami TaxID=75366 RepID=A0A672K940_SINGR
MDQNAKKICQKLQSVTKKSDFLYASLYSTFEKIPLYSAYKFDPKCSGTSTQSWHIEPQLISSAENDYMMLEGATELKNKKHELKKTQALSSDYDQTGYDRGHLYPNSFQCGEDRKATFTLTNAAPMDACFNRIHWKLWEGYLQRFLKDNLNKDNGDNDNKKASAYIVTGTVPGQDKIPQSGNRDLRRVTVPSHIWTAVCYEHSEEHDKSFSFGYIGINQPEFNIKLMSVSEMKKQLKQQIFQDDCFSDRPASDEAKNQFLNRIKLPEHQRLQMSKIAQNNFLAVEDVISSDSRGPANKPTITDLTATLNYDSLSSYLPSTEGLKRKFKSACVVTAVKKRHTSDKQKREVSEDSIECRLVPEKSVDGKTAADGSPCNRFVNNGNKFTCFTQEGKDKSCCSTPCLYLDQLKGYHCYSGETQIQCSPQYSLITAKGNRCRDDHPCATYGEDYYWCFINDKSWEYCSP